jgi:hypothetical protein
MKHLRRSEWILYYERDPQRGNIGREAPLPVTTDLELYAQFPGNPYDENDKDDVDVGFPATPPEQFVFVPRSPPESETIGLAESIENIEVEFLPMIASHRRSPPASSDTGICLTICYLGSPLHKNISPADSACNQHLRSAPPECDLSESFPTADQDHVMDEIWYSSRAERFVASHASVPSSPQTSPEDQSELPALTPAFPDDDDVMDIVTCSGRLCIAS